MEAPEKIFIPVVDEEGKRLLSTIWWPEDNRTQNEKFVIDVIPYIRKDALLEWASRLKEKWEEPPMSRHSPGCVYMLEQLINKLNSM